MQWTWMHSTYLLFAMAHPISELIRGISLQKFLNLDYYIKGQDNFPVSRREGVKGSLFVLIVLVLPFVFTFVFTGVFPILWCLAFGLAVADLIQHVVHFIRGRRKKAPFVHLITILGVCYFLWRIAPKLENLSALQYLLGLMALLAGALLIFGNWWKNSSRVRKGVPAAPGQVLQT